MLAAVQAAMEGGARLLIGGDRVKTAKHRDGYFMAPTLLENVRPDDEISRTELFGPVACLYPVGGFAEALELANRTAFGLTAAVHTRNVNRAMTFLSRIRSGVASINGPTYGSEPHMPFGGLGDSGNGFREAGTEVLDVYSEWKTVYINYDSQAE
jgi:aldehyde dehydrogenase (NAD+)